MNPEGLLLVDKPGGITSHDVVARVRRALGTRKVGHAGTLDPLATGLMLVGVGRGTRLLRYLTGLDKTYEATIRLGVTTDTLDADGTVLATSDIRPSQEALAAAVASLEGASLQRPPAYSAVKVGGRKLYEAARAGEELQAEPRPIRVYRAAILGSDGRDVRVEIGCSSGTYVRVLAADLGEALGCGAHLAALRRSRVGDYLVTDAQALDDELRLLPVERMVDGLAHRSLSADETDDVRHGRTLTPSETPEPVAVFASDGTLVAVYRDRDERARAEMVLPPP